MLQESVEGRERRWQCQTGLIVSRIAIQKINIGFIKSVGVRVNISTGRRAQPEHSLRNADWLNNRKAPQAAHWATVEGKEKCVKCEYGWGRGFLHNAIHNINPQFEIMTCLKNHPGSDILNCDKLDLHDLPHQLHQKNTNCHMSGCSSTLRRSSAVGKTRRGRGRGGEGWGRKVNQT